MIAPRPETLRLSEAVHGSVNEIELAALGIDPCSVLDFSASINPFGPSPKALAAIGQAAIDRYPDREASELRQALADEWEISPQRLIVGNGSSELLSLIAWAWLRPDDAVVIVGPTYAEYERVATLMGASIIRCDAVLETNFQVPDDLIEQTLRSRPVRALFLCNPNNPTGQLASADTIAHWAVEFGETLFVVDEAYLDFAVEDQSLVAKAAGNLIVVRSLTKAYSLAGLRLGYAAASEETIGVLRRIRPPWSVNAVAQAAGAAAVKDREHLRQTLGLWRQAKAQLESGLVALGLRPVPSAAPYLLVPVGDASQLRGALLRRRILVRDCASFGLAAYLRLSPRTPAENEALLEALDCAAGNVHVSEAG